LQEAQAKGFDRCREMTLKNIEVFFAARDAMLAAAPTPPAAAQEDGRDAARRERDRLFCEAIVANQFQDEHRGGRLTVDVKTLLHYFNENRPDAAMLTSPDSGKEGDRG
jgi:hypothetical protein